MNYFNNTTFVRSLFIAIVVVGVFSLCSCKQHRAKRIVMAEVTAGDSVCPLALDDYTTLSSISYVKSDHAVKYLYSKNNMTTDSFAVSMEHKKDSVYDKWKDIVFHGNSADEMIFLQALADANMQICYCYLLQPSAIRDSFFITNQEIKTLLSKK